jgi:hypothetical protein
VTEREPGLADQILEPIEDVPGGVRGHVVVSPLTPVTERLRHFSSELLQPVGLFAMHAGIALLRCPVEVGPSLATQAWYSGGFLILAYTSCGLARYSITTVLIGCTADHLRSIVTTTGR